MKIDREKEEELSIKGDGNGHKERRIMKENKKEIWSVIDKSKKEQNVMNE